MSYTFATITNNDRKNPNNVPAIRDQDLSVYAELDEDFVGGSISAREKAAALAIELNAPVTVYDQGFCWAVTVGGRGQLLARFTCP